MPPTYPPGQAWAARHLAIPGWGPSPGFGLKGPCQVTSTASMLGGYHSHLSQVRQAELRPPHLWQVPWRGWGFRHGPPDLEQGLPLGGPHELISGPHPRAGLGQNWGVLALPALDPPRLQEVGRAWVHSPAPGGQGEGLWGGDTHTHTVTW